MVIQTERVNIDYDLQQLKGIQRKSQILSLQIEDKSEEGINTIWENQEQCGKEINELFNNRKIISILVYGKTQTGKTGCMTALIQHHVLSNNIPIENIYIITGLSDTAWKKDTKSRMPDSINNRVFHRAQLLKLASEIRTKTNLLIIIDEIQIACAKDQTIYKTFDKCGFYDLEFLLAKDIKLVQFSATPDGHINDISDWKEHSGKLKLNPGEGYTGTKELKEQGRIKPFKDLTSIANVEQLVSDVNNFDPVFYKEGDNLKQCYSRYHTIRIPNSRNGHDKIVIDNFKSVFGDTCEYNTEYLQSKKDDINKILKKPPLRHTFIFIKEILRCAKTKYKLFIGVEYERWTTVSDSSIIQGSVGRLTGYDDNTDSICYTNLDTIDNYEKLWENNFEFKEGIIWNTNTTLYDDNEKKTYSKGTFNSTKNIKGLESNSSKKEKYVRPDPKIKKFDGEAGQEGMIGWFNDNLKGMMPKGKRGPRRKIKIKGELFYRATIRKKYPGEILHCSIIEKEKKWGFGKDPGIRSYPCYSDVTDPDTLQWWLIYYEK